MVTQIKKFFSSHLSYKIWIATVVPVLFIFLLIIIFLSIYVNTFLLKSSIENAQQDTDSLSSKFSETYENLLVRFVLKTSSIDFLDTYQVLASCTPEQYVYANIQAQDLLSEYIQMSNLVQFSIISKTGRTDGQPMVFAPYTFTLHNPNPDYDLGYDLQDVNGLTLLANTESPFRNYANVLPLVIPLRFNSSRLLISDSIEQSDFILYLFLDADVVNEYFELYCDDDSQGTIFLIDNEGNSLTLDSNNDFKYYNDPDLQQTLVESTKTGHSGFYYKNNYIYLSKIRSAELYLVNIVPVDKFSSSANALRWVLQIVAVSSVVAVTVICLLISLFVTRPLQRLMNVVHSIQKGCYDGKTQIDTQDEVAQLEQSIQSMYRTIQTQIEEIRREEVEKRNAEMQLLTEQINPHFLYNTLEFINMEVFQGHGETASKMITSLADFTRITLSCGDNQLYISQELEHVMAYIDIMGSRFSSNIHVVIDVPEQLRHKKITKCILQPLVENSLKHGFSIDKNCNYPILPKLEISMQLTQEELLICITDNGVGIDIERANQIMHNKHPDGKSDRHIGLNNIYSRLCAFYGDVDITFSSIPFFENQVCIHLPSEPFWDEFDDGWVC